MSRFCPERHADVTAPAAPSAWFAGLDGRRVELLRPTAHEVDWAEITWALAHINRYNGHAETPVSVGLHTLIVADAAPPALKPHALLHDAHEARLGDTTSPVKEAWLAVALMLFGEPGRLAVEGVRRELELRHDVAIHEAAGVALPTAAEKAAIKALDLRALATERRDFKGGRSNSPEWLIDRERVEPFPKVWRFRAPVVVADVLLDAFRTWLPALRGGGARCD